MVCSSNAERPLIVILGWLGCTPQRLAKYTDWYKAEKFETLSYIPPITSVILPFQAKYKSDQLRQQIAHQLKPKQLPQQKIIFHIFSGNGIHFYAHFLQNLNSSVDELPEETHQKQQIYDSLCGCIIDSAPPDFSPESFTYGFVGATLGMVSHYRKHWTIKIFKKQQQVKIERKFSMPEYTHPILTPMVSWIFKLYWKRPSFHDNYSKVKHTLFYGQKKSSTLVCIQHGRFVDQLENSGRVC